MFQVQFPSGAMPLELHKPEFSVLMCKCAVFKAHKLCKLLSIAVSVKWLKVNVEMACRSITAIFLSEAILLYNHFIKQIANVLVYPHSSMLYTPDYSKSQPKTLPITCD